MQVFGYENLVIYNILWGKQFVGVYYLLITQRYCFSLNVWESRSVVSFVFVGCKTSAFCRCREHAFKKYLESLKLRSAFIQFIIENLM